MKVAVIGGTGTLGSSLIEHLSKSNHQIISVSRDELKQQILRVQYPKVRFVMADIRDKQSIKMALRGVDVVFHTAALKHVDILEENPAEAFKTNVLGTMNVAEAAIEVGVPKVVFSSTDKAVLPINTYGYTKALSEKYLFSLNFKQLTTRFVVYRWGNVIGSRGSAVHTFVRSLKEKGEINLTDKAMTRFWIRIEDAVKYMIESYEWADTDEPMIPTMKASSVQRLALAISETLGILDPKINVIGLRAGEKIHECLMSSHSGCLRSDTAPQYTRDELLKLLKGIV